MPSGETSQPLSMAGTKGSPLRLNDDQRAHYAALARRARTHRQTIHIAARTGEAFAVEKGQMLRVTCRSQPQSLSPPPCEVSCPSAMFKAPPCGRAVERKRGWD